MENQIVVFELAGEQFGVNIASVESIIKMQPITVVPQSPPFVKGVINLRGKVEPVMDTSRRFGLAEQLLTKDTRIIVIHMDQTVVGMIVDGVSEVLTVPEDSIEPTPLIATTIHSAFITGIAKMSGNLIILLDLNKVLSLDEQIFAREMIAVADN